MRWARAWLRVLIAGIAAAQLTACGYLIFPERAGQPTGRLDLAVVGLDAAGLLFGVVPGVVAFAVDFATGCIYLPAEPYAEATSTVPATGEARAWEEVAVVGPHPGLHEVAAVLTAHLGDPKDTAQLADKIRWSEAPR